MFSFFYNTIFILISGLSIAQTTYFKSIAGGLNNQTSTFTVDSINNKLYVFGGFNKIINSNMSVKHAAIWDGVKWDSIRHIVGDSIDQITNINNVLYGVGFIITKLNSSTLHWDVIARPDRNGYFRRITKFNGDLIIFGSQDSINGQKVSQLVKYDGTNFTSIQGNLEIYSNVIMCEYNGELYAGGSLYVQGQGPCDLAKWNGTTWSIVPLTNTIPCSFCGLGTLIVYQNKLFIGGRFMQTSQSSLYTNLLSWDGTNIVDYGLLGTSVESAWDMCIYKNKLIITGFLNSPVPLSSQQFTGFLSYDGTDMCSYVPHYYNNQPYRLMAASVFQDSLIFLSTRKMSPTDTVNYICKFVGDINNPLYCVTGVGVKENYMHNEAFKIYPNPTSNLLNISDENNAFQNSTIEIKNYLGQVVFTTPFASQINLQNLSAGMYFLTIQDKSSSKTVKFIKQ